MNKRELTQRLARRSRQSQGRTADNLDTLIYQLWRDSRQPADDTPAKMTGKLRKDKDALELSSAPKKKQ